MIPSQPPRVAEWLDFWSLTAWPALCIRAFVLEIETRCPSRYCLPIVKPNAKKLLSWNSILRWRFFSSIRKTILSFESSIDRVYWHLQWTSSFLSILPSSHSFSVYHWQDVQGQHKPGCWIHWSWTMCTKRAGSSHTTRCESTLKTGIACGSRTVPCFIMDYVRGRMDQRFDWTSPTKNSDFLWRELAYMLFLWSLSVNDSILQVGFGTASWIFVLQRTVGDLSGPVILGD